MNLIYEIDAYLRSVSFKTKVVAGMMLFLFFCMFVGLIRPLLIGQDQPITDELAGLFGASNPKVEYKYTSPWAWTCGKNGTCQRILRSSVVGDPISLEGCWLTCGADRTLWPKPRSHCQTLLGTETFAFFVQNISLHVTSTSNEVKALAEEAFDVFKKNVEMLHPKNFLQSNTNSGFVTITLRIRSAQKMLTIITDEQYDLSIQEEATGSLSVMISGETFFGVRHGLETLGQLIVFDDFENSLKILKDVELSDGPAFPYRGLMIDTARHFIPIPALKRMVDGMGQNKLNVLHWHITDSNSFPLYCTSFPQMTDYGAHSKDEIYYPEEVKEFVHYALIRGVKVIPELDAPAHAGNGWQWGTQENGFGKLALCVNEEPFRKMCWQPPCGQLNPSNPKVYEVLRGIYSDMLSLFDPDVFHMGGDEVKYDCWKTDENWAFYYEQNMTEPVMMRTYFQKKALDALKTASRSIGSAKDPIPMIWISDLTYAIPRLNNTGIDASEYIIQFWQEVPSRSAPMRDLLDLNFPAIVSNYEFLYLNLGLGSWLGSTDHSQYRNWQVLYNFDFVSLGYNTTKRVFSANLGDIPQILGAEATVWTEKINENTLDAILWPRSVAFAERLWLHPDSNNTNMKYVHARLLRQNERMRQRGIRVNAGQPTSCRLIHGSCENTWKPPPPPTSTTTTRTMTNPDETVADEFVP